MLNAPIILSDIIRPSFDGRSYCSRCTKRQVMRVEKFYVAKPHILYIIKKMLARRRLGLKSHSRSSPVTGGLALGVCLQATRAACESFRTSGIHEYPRCPADSANGGGYCPAVSQGKGFFCHCSFATSQPSETITSPLVVLASLLQRVYNKPLVVSPLVV